MDTYYVNGILLYDYMILLHSTVEMGAGKGGVNWKTVMTRVTVRIKFLEQLKSFR